MSRITIYNRRGLLIADIDATAKRSWLKNRYGAAQFALSVNDSKCREDILRWGNLVLIEHEKLPAWGGYIIPNREWGNGAVLVNARSIFGKLENRWGQGVVNISGAPGYAIESIIAKANILDDTRIRAGKVSRYGTVNIYSIAENVNMYTFITQMIDEYKNYILDFAPSFDDSGRLMFLANWDKQAESGDISIRGKHVEYTGSVLMEGLNIEVDSKVLTEQGNIANSLKVEGTAANGADKKVVEVKDIESIERFGLFERYETDSTASTYVQTPLDSIANEKLAKMKQPRKLYNFKILDVGSLWNEVKIGAQFKCELYSAGFYGSGIGSYSTVRISGMAFSEQGKLEVTCEETD